MPMHDWTKVTAGTYHHFHYKWISTIIDRLDAGLLPAGFFALAEQVIARPEGDLVTLQTSSRTKPSVSPKRGAVIAPMQPKTTFVMQIPHEKACYARKANRIAVHHGLGDVVAVIEILSPGNKDRKSSVEAFVKKTLDLIWQRGNVLLIDPFPPGRHDPKGIHAALLAEMTDEDFTPPPDKALTLAAYQVEPSWTAFVEPIAVRDHLPDMPLFLEEDKGVSVPLEETYQATWSLLPEEVRGLLE